MGASKKIALVLMLVVLLVGIFSAIDLAYIHFKVNYSNEGYKSFCNISETLNCDAVATSSWATLFGVPISILGVMTYLLAFLMGIMRLVSKKERVKNLSVYLVFIGFGSVLYTIYLAWICYSQIGSWCIMCMVLYGVNVALFLLALLSSGIRLKRYPETIRKDVAFLFAKPTRILAIATLLLGVVVLFAVGSFLEYRVTMERLKNVLEKVEPLAESIPVQGRSFGAKEGKLALLVYTDYQCPFCRELEVFLEEMTEKYRELTIIRKDFPLDNKCNPILKRPFHPYACEAALYGICAHEEGKFDAFRRLMIEHQRSISPKLFATLGASLGIEQESLAACAQSDKAKDALESDIQEGVKLKLRATPTIIINGKEKVQPGLTHGEIEKLIQLKLKYE